MLLLESRISMGRRIRRRPELHGSFALIQQQMASFTPYNGLSQPPVEQTNMTGAGDVNQTPEMINQAALYLEQFNAPTFQTPLGPQQNQIRAVNGVFDLQLTDHIPYGAPHLRPQVHEQFWNQPQQQDQVFLWNPQGPAGHSGLSHHQSGDGTGFNQSPRLLESLMVERAQPWYEVQGNRTRVMPFALNPQQTNEDSNVFASGYQEIGGQLAHVQMVPNVVANSTISNSVAPWSSMLPRFPPAQLEELTGVNITPTDGTFQQGTPDMRGYKRRAMYANRYELGESSRKSSKQKSSKQKKLSTDFNHQEVSIPSDTRKGTNG